MAPRSTTVPESDEGCLVQECLTAERKEAVPILPLPAHPYWHLVLPWLWASSHLA